MNKVPSIQRSTAAVLCCAMFSFAAEAPIGPAVKHAGDSPEIAKSGDSGLFIALGKGRLTKVLPDGPIGRIDIPRVGVSSVILEGADSDILALGAGHVPGTALLGSDGNVALAAHRDTFFRGLEYIRVGTI